MVTILVGLKKHYGLTWMSDISTEVLYVWVVISVCSFKNTAGLLTSAIMLYTIQCWMILNFIWIVLSTLLKSILDVWYKLNDLNCPVRETLEFFGMIIHLVI